MASGLMDIRVMAGRASVLAVCALASTACGSKQSADIGGSTAAQRKAVSSALNLLQHTKIPRTVVAISFQIGQAPSTCTVIPGPGTQGIFELFVAWKPTNPNADVASAPQSVLEATIDDGSFKNDRFHVSSFGSGVPEPAGVKASLVRAVLSTLAQRCEVLENGDLRLVSPD
jgi:hypothetical protein